MLLQGRDGGSIPARWSRVNAGPIHTPRLLAKSGLVVLPTTRSDRAPQEATLNTASEPTDTSAMDDYNWDRALDELEALLDELDGSGEVPSDLGEDGVEEDGFVLSLSPTLTDEERDRAAALLARSVLSQQRLVQALEQAFRRFDA